MDSDAVARTLIPQPHRVSARDGAFSLHSDTVMSVVEEAESAAEYLRDRLQATTGFELKYGAAETHGIHFIFDEALQDEAYALTVTEDFVNISSGSASGFFYAVQSLLQLMPAEVYGKQLAPDVKWSIAACEISDAPKYRWRGLMIDLSRHFFGLETLKDMVDWMAMHKLNRFHLHLTDSPAWRLEIKGYPKLTEIGAKGTHSDPNAPAQFLTQDQVKALVAYAKKQHILVVPEIDVPGHFGAAARAYPELDGGANTLKVTAPEVDEFIETVFTQLGELFESPYIHFGGDEVRYHAWDKQPDMMKRRDELGLKNQHELEAWFDRKIADFLVAKGYRPMAWDEAAGFGVNKETIIQWWRCLNPESLPYAIKQGHEVIISPADHTYFDYPYTKEEPGAHWEGLRNGGNSSELIYNWQPIPDGLTDQERGQILGFEACLWSEFMQTRERLEYLTFPRLAAYAEVAWGNKLASYADYQRKLPLQLKRYEVMQLNYRKPGIGHALRKTLQPEGYQLP